MEARSHKKLFQLKIIHQIKIILNHQEKLTIVNNLIKLFDSKPVLNYETTNLSPGNFIKFDYILNSNNINLITIGDGSNL